MQLSGIGSRNTYSKCLKELHQYGYIVYSPSLHKYHRPKVSIIRWETSIPPCAELPFSQPTPVGNKVLIIEPPAVSGFCKPPFKHEQIVCPGMSSLLLKIDSLVCSNMGHYNKQYINNINKERAALPQNHPPPENQKNKPALRAAAFEQGTATVPPAVEAVQAYFAKAGFPEKEALRFFNHYQASGWILGQTPIIYWPAAANKWIINIPDFKTNTHARATRNNASDHLNAQQNEDYSEPL
jgi:hypothetical protein